MKAPLGVLWVLLLMVALLPLLDVPAGAIPDGPAAAAGGSIGATTGGSAGGLLLAVVAPLESLLVALLVALVLSPMPLAVSPAGAPLLVSLVYVLPLSPPVAARVALCCHRYPLGLACSESSRPPGGAVGLRGAPSGRK